MAHVSEEVAGLEVVIHQRSRVHPAVHVVGLVQIAVTREAVRVGVAVPRAMLHPEIVVGDCEEVSPNLLRIKTRSWKGEENLEVDLRREYSVAKSVSSGIF